MILMIMRMDHTAVLASDPINLTKMLEKNTITL